MGHLSYHRWDEKQQACFVPSVLGWDLAIAISRSHDRDEAIAAEIIDEQRGIDDARRVAG
jgi:hypothetical protein